MKVTDARFVKSVYQLQDLPRPGLPELAFAGRSNVGKSSLINVLLNRRGFAKTSATPGRTQSINFMEINSSFYFVDLPGYGYASVPLAVRENWGPLIEGYLKQRATLCLLVLLGDIRREPQEDEELFIAWLRQHDIPLMVVLTKIDKLKKNSQVASLRRWQKLLGGDEKIVLFSALTGEGKEQLWRSLNQSLRSVK